MTALQSIAPGFRAYWNDPENLHVDDDGSYTFHGMFSEFSSYVLDHFESLDEHVRIQLFEFIEACVSHHPRSDTDLGNAAYTCFLENVTNDPVSSLIRPYLGPESLAYFDEWDKPAGPDAT